MASRVYDVVELELQDGTVVEVKPLPIKRLRRFMTIIKKLGEPTEDEDQMVDVLLEAAAVVLEKKWPDISNDRDRLEELLDVPTLMKMCEVAGGLNFSGDADPNLTNPLGMI